MSVIADFSVPANAWCLGETLTSLSSATVELDRLVAHSPDYVMPFLWVLNTTPDAFDEAVAADPTVDSATVTDSFDDAHLYQITWAAVVSDRLTTILDHEGVILDARGSGGQWRFWVRFGSRKLFATFQEHFEPFGSITLHRLSQPTAPGGVSYGVSEKQREALLAAYDAGYYEDSGTTGADLADQLHISQQAVSHRLRRGVRNLIENTLDRHRTA